VCMVCVGCLWCVCGVCVCGGGVGVDNINPRPAEWEQKCITHNNKQQIENICEPDCEIYYQLQQHLKSSV